MVKIAIGIVLGLTVSALAQSIDLTRLPGALMAAANPEGNAAVIKVDGKGRVYCSPETMRE